VTKGPVAKGAVPKEVPLLHPTSVIVPVDARLMDDVSVQNQFWLPQTMDVTVPADGIVLAYVSVPKRVLLLQPTGVIIPTDAVVLDDVTVPNVVSVALLAWQT
jgi:hypothetical protein